MFLGVSGERPVSLDFNGVQEMGLKHAQFAKTYEVKVLSCVLILLGIRIPTATARQKQLRWK